MRQSVSMSRVRVETIKDVGSGPSPFELPFEETALGQALVTLVGRPVPQPRRPMARKSR